ncbi:MAG: S26 family signal peptidase [Clostridiales bacterium]|nr:S26 family signal peptidase [Clostridiales bacterium]
MLVKRVAALPEDIVLVRSQVLIVPDGCRWVLGDNQDESVDSRSWDDPFVPEEWGIAKLWSSN